MIKKPVLKMSWETLSFEEPAWKFFHILLKSKIPLLVCCPKQASVFPLIRQAIKTSGKSMVKLNVRNPNLRFKKTVKYHLDAFVNPRNVIELLLKNIKDRSLDRKQRLALIAEKIKFIVSISNDSLLFYLCEVYEPDGHIYLELKNLFVGNHRISCNGFQPLHTKGLKIHRKWFTESHSGA